jgi:hypothetical protein
MTLRITAANNGQVFANLLLLGTAYTGPMVNSGDNAELDGIVWQRVTLLNKPDEGQNAETGFHLYNERDALYRSCSAIGIEKEHGWYPHAPRGNTQLIGCKALECGAQAYQEVWRDLECDKPYDGAESSVSLVGFQALQCGLPRGVGRASYCLTFGPHQDGGGQTTKEPWNRSVHLKDVVIEHIVTGPAPYQLKGGLLVQFRPSLLVEGGRTVYRSPLGQDRALWLVPDTDHVVIDGHHFEGTKRLDFQRIKSLRITNCTGSVQFRIDGKVIGRVDQDFSWAA